MAHNMIPAFRRLRQACHEGEARPHRETTSKKQNKFKEPIPRKLFKTFIFHSQWHPPVVYPVRDIIIIAQPRVPRNTPVVQLQGKCRSTNKLETSTLSIFNYCSTGLSEGSQNSITLNNGTACKGCSPMHTRSTPIPKNGRTKKGRSRGQQQRWVF